MAELIDDDAGHLRQERLLQAELAAGADRTPEDAAQDVRAALIPRQDAVGDQKRTATGVIGDDAQGAIRLRSRRHR